MSSNYILEYIWIDADSNIRSKTKIVSENEYSGGVTLSQLSTWTYDGSSTRQATGPCSDVNLVPVNLYNDPFRQGGYIVLCETRTQDGQSHPDNNRSKCQEYMSGIQEQEPLYGIEQEYVIFERDGKPYGWVDHTTPGSGRQGPYYCGVGGNVSFGRHIVEDHMWACLQAGLKICGVNAEVMPSQWEYQIGPLDGLEVSDQLWVSRYILQRVCEKYNCYASFHPKPVTGDWNGSGCHTNFSTHEMRESNGLYKIKEACKRIGESHNEDLKYYGQENESRMTGMHETSNMDKYDYGIGTRGCSIRIPLHVVNSGCGYLEDRRPGANMDPYLVVWRLTSACLG